MTTLTRPEAGAGARPPADLPPTTTRFGNWRGSWAVALRMARREVRRHRGRSLISLIMVGVPTALLAFALTFYPTSEITGAERIPYELGNAAASFIAPTTDRVVQEPTSGNWFSGSDTGGPGTPATPLPGWTPGGSVDQLATALQRTFGGEVVPSAQTQTRIAVGDRSRRVDLLVTPDPAAFGSSLRLDSGRWPTSKAEVLVSRRAVDSGLLRDSGTLTIDNAARTTVRIVGVADARTTWGMFFEGIVGTDTFGEPLDASMPQYYLFRDAPFTWADVKEANAFGIPVSSAEVLRNPPATSELDPAVARSMADGQRTEIGLVVAGGAILLIVVTLLVGPAFAVGAARQRRTLALAASNGATTAQLRRTVLSQAVVLGALAAIVGAVLGVLAVPVVTRWVLPLWTPWSGGPLDIPWLQVVAVMLVSLLSALVAAVIPARRLGRLDIVGVMKGQNVSPPPSRVLFVLGLVGAVLGGGVLFYGIITRGPEVIVVAGALFLIVGALLLVPVLLTLAARLARHLPVALRMATRDAARQRARSAPSVAAVVGAVAALTMMGVGLTSDTEEQRRDYVPTTLQGEAVVYLDEGDAKAAQRTTEALVRTVPSLVVVPTYRVGSQNGWYSMSGQAVEGRVSFVNYRPEGCTTEQSVNGTPDEVPADGSAYTPRCNLYGTNGGASYGGILAVDAAELDRRLDLSDSERQVLADGGAIAFTTSKLPATMTIVHGTAKFDPNNGLTSDIVETGRHDLRVVLRPLDRSVAPMLLDQAGLYVTTATARANGWPLTSGPLAVHDRSGTIGGDAEERINAALERDAYVNVERGFQRDDILVMAVLVGVFSFLILVITLTSTALSMAEQQRDDATLAAVGATRRTRRAMAAAQATVISLIGALIGLAVGLVPGIAIAYPLTGRQDCDQFTNTCTNAFVDPVIRIPWLWFGVIVVAVPLVAALVSAVAVRREPVMTRRAT